MNVKVYSMEQFHKTEIVEHAISIRNAFYCEFTPVEELEQRIETSDFKSVLRLEFDDVLTEDHGIPFSTEQAKQVLAFIQGKEHSNFAIHCMAGMSRSVAIGRFLKDFYGADTKYVTCGTDKFYNVHVYNLLRRAYYSIEEK